MTPESAPNPPPEGSYDSRAFMRMAHNPSYFRSRMPLVVTDIADMSKEMVYAPELYKMRRGMQGLLREGPAEVNDIVYSSFARKQGWAEKSLFGDSGGVKPMQDLTEDQIRKWQEFRRKGKILRHVAIDALSLAILPYFAELPNIEPDSDPVLEELSVSLRRAPYQITHSLFPDLNDEEAKRLFSNRTAVDIRTLAEEANRTDPPAYKKM